MLAQWAVQAWQISGMLLSESTGDAPDICMYPGAHTCICAGRC